jgi:hypothetical protein
MCCLFRVIHNAILPFTRPRSGSLSPATRSSLPHYWSGPLSFPAGLFFHRGHVAARRRVHPRGVRVAATRLGGLGRDGAACACRGDRGAEAGEGDPAEEEAAEVVDGDGPRGIRRRPGHRQAAQVLVWGKEDLDPVGNTDDFIWNKDFLPHMERVVSNGGADTALAITRLAPVPRLPSFDPFVAL